MKDYRLFFDSLWRRGRYWDQADYDDIGGYEAWRRGSMDAVGGADRPVRMGPSPQTVQACRRRADRVHNADNGDYWSAVRPVRIQVQPIHGEVSALMRGVGRVVGSRPHAE